MKHRLSVWSPEFGKSSTDFTDIMKIEKLIKIEEVYIIILVKYRCKASAFKSVIDYSNSVTNVESNPRDNLKLSYSKDMMCFTDCGVTNGDSACRIEKGFFKLSSHSLWLDMRIYAW